MGKTYKKTEMQRLTVMAALLGFGLATAMLILATFSMSVGRLRSASQIAYERHTDTRRDIMLLDVLSERQFNLTRSPADEFGPAWNASGSQLRYHVYDSQHSEILYSLDPNTFEQSALATNTGADEAAVRAAWYAEWEPHYAFTVGYGQIWIGGVGTAPIPVGYGFDPAWSPTGDLVLYYADAPGELNAEVYAYDPVARRTLNLSQHQAHDWNPVWSPDGQRVAFVSGRAGSADLYLVPLSCAERQSCERDAIRLTFTPQSEIGPSWSPDGRELAFARISTSGYQLFTLNLETGEERQITRGAAHHRAPAWRP